MKIHHLQYFVALATRSNFREAAEACHVSQPAMSMAIRTFEERLGQKLFIRQSSPVTLSPHGEKILPFARRILYDYECMLQLGHEQKDIDGHLRIGVIPTIAPNLLPRIIGQYREKYPEVTLDIEEQITSQLISKIMGNDLDVAIVATPLEGIKLKTHPLYYEEFMAYTTGVGEKSYILPEDLDLKQLWILKEGHCFRNQIINLCELQQDTSSELNYHAGSIETLVNLVDRFGGVTIIPELAAEDLSPSRKKKLRLFQSPAPVREVSLIFHQYTIKEAHIEALSKVISKAIPKHMKEKDSFTAISID